MKTCTVCKVVKPKNEFYSNRGRCKPCIRLQIKIERKQSPEKYTRKGWYKQNKGNIRESNKKHKQNIQSKLCLMISELKKAPCMDCLQNYPEQAMDFDHRPEENKKNTVSKLVQGAISVKAVLIEIQKCDLLCACCHRHRTHQRNMKNRKPIVNKPNEAYRKRVLWLETLKNQPCSKCDQQFYPWQLDFDHIDSRNKTYSIANMIQRRMSKDKILKELTKCRLLCACCHRIITQMSRAELGIKFFSSLKTRSSTL